MELDVLGQDWLSWLRRSMTIEIWNNNELSRLDLHKGGQRLKGAQNGVLKTQIRSYKLFIHAWFYIIFFYYYTNIYSLLKKNENKPK